MELKAALSRLQTLRGHVNPSHRAEQEREKATFDVDEMRNEFFKLLPKNVFDSYDAFSEVKSLENPAFLYKERYEGAEYGNDVFYEFISKLFEKGVFTPESIADNIDIFIQSASLPPFMLSTVTLVKINGHFGLYCKTIKNVGTEKHRKSLLDGCACKDFGAF